MPKNSPAHVRPVGAKTLQAVIGALVLTVPFVAYPQTPTQSTQPIHGPGTELSRAEVIADLALWRRAGMDRYETLSLSYGMETQAYRAASEEYLRLRNSEQFQIEVQKARKD
ncbi:DUF4148 domain-containing protein [Acidovorax sp. NCPPB 4044]|uniref:DUF4148 domain-containing protein n=1 Tax=Acidovorax sp. NCPPB 4044 TaxID=2940490 RepID=UPI002302DB20|nr:DUF4148 domain-containing protein [Acidovorax sp. NCPPB 4044]MDA8522896.1 DUF4148 domain-containing protein [Acidovorax sp. NCPPB 4044]